MSAGQMLYVDSRQNLPFDHLLANVRKVPNDGRELRRDSVMN